MKMNNEFYLCLKDEQWPYEYTNHTRKIARAVVFDDDNNYYFVKTERDDEFGKLTSIETAGGGVEEDETYEEAIRRELKEELGVYVEIIEKIGVVEDDYNLLHRHNINNYFLCKITSFTETDMTEDEIKKFHLSTIRLSLDEAIEKYEKLADTKLGILLRNREVPVLLQAKRILNDNGYNK